MADRLKSKKTLLLWTVASILLLLSIAVVVIPAVTGSDSIFDVNWTKIFSKEEPQHLACLPFDDGYDSAFVETRAEGGQMFKTAFYYSKEKIINTKAAIIFINGGPGHSSRGFFHAIKTKVKPESFPLVFFDQRGTGCSQPRFPDPTAQDDQKIWKYFTAPYMAKDVALMIEYLKTLGAERFFVIGHSYGGRIAYEVGKMRIPEVQIAFGWAYQPFEPTDEWLKMRMLKLQKAQEKYFAEYQDDRKLVETIREALTDKTCIENKSARLCGPDIVDGLYSSFMFESTWPDLHEMIAEASSGNFESLLKKTEDVMETTFTEYVAFADYHVGKRFTDYCREIEDSYTKDPLIDECRFSTSQHREKAIQPNEIIPNPGVYEADPRLIYFIGEDDPITGIFSQRLGTMVMQGMHDFFLKGTLLENVLKELLQTEIVD